MTAKLIKTARGLEIPQVELEQILFPAALPPRLRTKGCFHWSNAVTWRITWKLQQNPKITKIARALWLAERGVCMRVCKQGCDVKMFCFSRANHASTNLKKILSWKTRQVYFIYPFPRRLKVEKSLETSCVCCAYQLICIMTISTYTTGARTHFFTVQEPSWRVISALTPVV